MDVAYDHVQEKNFPEDAKKSDKGEKTTDPDHPDEATVPKPTLNSEFQEAYKSISSTPWGAKLGGFFSDVRKQSSTFYEEARQEATAVSGEAVKGFQDLRSTLAVRARSLSGADNTLNATKSAPKEGEQDQGTAESTGAEDGDTPKDTTEEGLNWQRFRSEAAKRLKDLEKAEEAADAAIFRFGKNLGSFLKDAVTISAPSDEDSGKSKVLFESKGADGKRVIHSTRLEAQLHAIHSSAEKFLADPEEVNDGEWAKWKEEFSVEKKTNEIARDLERYQELKVTHSKIVPEKVEYADFWRRYYFLRMLLEREELRRREVLKGATLPTSEEPSWDDDSDSDSSPTPQQPSQLPSTPPTTSTDPNASSETPQQPARNASPASLKTIHPAPDSDSHLKPSEPRRSQDEKSQADSDASYDLVSGATSRTPGSPREKREDEEEDWE
ncbi:uncharacterized protein KY384_002799 [Bacidia gigantensis]|uniref:uncharacterized protein n=1 Tax=Bacidia gigantensis TaxID=2732470 RepID=UPI001D04DE7A|nr:uncharacterized protein KY384_002799 [Bacidia gigantensis]KAG8532921.1 hypothetical protein KY384_002799 [Bacidia gigantensis]